ncbi:Hypothetical predicted protein [Pelobates cultripes]|uniref:Uncharacterized protein n=1 Tax=Pelobates cultripes TaxID=61616 RepID=A0AAD1RR63_PELCU|nr:Hypothetical predicted protein [Pelobates cultripes]
MIRSTIPYLQVDERPIGPYSGFLDGAELQLGVLSSSIRFEYWRHLEHDRVPLRTLARVVDFYSDEDHSPLRSKGMDGFHSVLSQALSWAQMRILRLENCGHNPWMMREATYYIKIRIWMAVYYASPSRRCPSNYNVWLCMDYVSILLYMDRFDGTGPWYLKHSDSNDGLSFVHTLRIINDWHLLRPIYSHILQL